MENKEYAKRAMALESNDQPRIIARLDDRVLLITLLQTLDQTRKQLGLIDQLKKKLFYGRESEYVEHVRKTTDKKVINDDETFKEYLDVVERFKADPRLMKILHGVLGVGSEVEEMIEALQAAFLTGKLDRVNWMEEDGDLRWYQNLFADVFGYTTNQVQKMNIDKLELRYKGQGNKESSFNEDGAVKRDLDGERQSLESNA